MKFLTVQDFTFNVNAISYLEHFIENDIVNDEKVIVYFIGSKIPHIIEMAYQTLVDILVPHD